VNTKPKTTVAGSGRWSTVSDTPHWQAARW
jgi:hypothetical protein